MNWYIRKNAETMFDSTGTILVHRDSWVTIQVDPEIGRYYLSQFNRSRTMLAGQIMAPKWGPHISLIRGEVVKDQELLAKTNGKNISFRYSPMIKWNERHAILTVECPEGLELREQLGLSREPIFPLHVTIGVIMQL